MAEFGLKELYDVVLKATYPIEINGRNIQAGEVVAAFDKIQVASIQENKSHVKAEGGYNNQALIYWDNTKEVNIQCAQGIFSKTQFALMTGAKLIKNDSTDLLVSKREECESDDSGNVVLAQTPVGDIFVYDKNFNKVEFVLVEDNLLHIQENYKELIIDYMFNYKGGRSTLTVGQEVIEGFLSFEGKTRVVDDITGQTHTALVRMPKIKLMSDMSIRLGRNAAPVVGNLKFVALPIGERGNLKAVEIIFLDDDIDSDM